MVRLSTLLAYGILTTGILAAGDLSTPTTAHAQSPEWTATLLVNPAPSPFLADWERNPRAVVLNLFYTGSAPRDYRIEIFARAQGRGELGRIISPPQFVTPGPVMQVYTSAEALQWERVSFDAAIEDLVFRTGVLPEGVLELCARVVDLQGARLAESCDRIRVALPSPPQLVLPENGGRVAPTRAVFQWTPVVAPPGVDLAYRVRIVERLAGQAPQTAIAANPPVYQEDLTGAPILVYPLDALPLREGREYAWQVEVVDGLGRPLPIGPRAGEIWVFQPGDPFALPPGSLAPLPDELALIPGVARLRGLNSARVTEAGTAYVVDGRLTLEVLAPFRATVEVRAEELEIGGLSFANPSFRSGRLRGRLAPGAVPESLAGGMVDLTELEYDPLTGITLAGQLKSTTGAATGDLTLGGRVALTAAGLRGTLTARARAGGDLLTLGDDPVRYHLRRLELSYPTGALQLDGELDLFGHPGGCGRVTARQMHGGRIRIALDCASTAAVPLLAGEAAALGPVLGAGRVTGWLEAAVGAGSGAALIAGAVTPRDLDFDLRLAGTLAPSGAPDAHRIGATVRLTPAEVALLALDTPRGGAPAAWDLGLLRLGLSNLEVPRLAYNFTTRRWDFELRFDAAIQLPELGDPAVPPIAGVTLSPSGITIPGTRAIWPYADPVLFSGFTMRPLSLELDTLRLGWGLQPAAPGAGLVLDLELGFAPDAPPALRSTKLRVSRAGYRGGRITGNITATGFDPALRLPIGERGLELALDRLGGTLTADAGRQQIAITGAGQIVTPDFMRCGKGPGSLALPGAELTISATGLISGRVTGLAPRCPIALGPLALEPHGADLGFTIAGDTQRVELDLDATLRLPPPPGGTPAAARGKIGIDLVRGQVTRGAIELADPFRWAVGEHPATGDPLLAFTLSRARLTAEGLTLSGEGKVELAVEGETASAGAAAAARFEDLTLSLPEWRITRGSARITGAFGLALEPGFDTVGWRLEERAADGATKGLRELILDAEGLHLAGERRAAVIAAGERVDVGLRFSSDFLIGLDTGPAVRRGRGGLLIEGTEVAYVDSTGFWLTDNPLALARLFGDLAELPERIGLPSESVAYLQLARSGTPAVLASVGAAGIRLRTAPGRSVDLVIPALAGDTTGSAAPPTIAAEFDVAYDPRTLRVTGGWIRAAGAPPAASPSDPARPILTLGEDDPRLEVTGIAIAIDQHGANLVLDAGAAIQLGATHPLRLGGQLRVGPGGPAGTLTATLAAGGPGLAGPLLETGPARITFREARLTLPGAHLELDGGLQLLGHDAANCGTLTARRDDDGRLTAHAACAPGVALPLGDGAAATLNLETLAGTLTLDPASGDLSYQLEAESRVVLPTDHPGPACEASFTIALTDGKLALADDSFRAECDGPAPIRMGWLDAELANLTLERLAYSPAAGLDLALRLDLALAVPGLLEVPGTVSVLVDRDGITIPEIEATVTAPPATLGGFGFRIDNLKLPGFTLGWRDWTARSADGFRFGLTARAWLAELPHASPSCLAGVSLTLNDAELGAGRLHATIAEHNFDPGCFIPLGGGTGFEVTRIAGDLALRLAPELTLESLPSIDGALRLPDYFACAAENPERRLRLATPLRLHPRGGVTGRVTGIAPGCPIDLPAVRITATDATLDLDFDPAALRQAATLQASAQAEFSVAENPVHGTGSLTIDLLAGQMIDGEILFAGPIRLDLPREQPVLSFRIGTAALDTAGLRIAGTSALLLEGGEEIGVTFQDAVINPLELRLTSGSILFERSFALKAGIDADGALAWRAVPAGSPVTGAAGLRADLPERVALTPAGFTIDGTASARLVYEGRELAALAAVFADLTLALNPAGVADGSLTLQYDGATVAIVDRLGFHPSLDYFFAAALPRRLPLPTEAAAYLELRDDAGDPRVALETTGAGARIYTAPGTTVPLVLPALAAPAEAAPRIEVALDLTLDPTGRKIVAGSIGARVPATGRDAFDLDRLGVPFAIDSIAYHDPGTGYQLSIAGHLTLFGDSPATADEIVLTIAGTGQIQGNVALAGLERMVPIGPDAEKLHFAVNALNGHVDVAPARGDLRYRLELDGAFALALGPAEQLTAAGTIEASDTGLRVKSIDLAATTGEEIRYLDLGQARLGLGNLRIPRLAYNGTTRDWDFELLLDAAFDFPALDALRLPAIRDIALRPDGFTIPAISIPELAADPFDLEGFRLRPLAFRMDSVRVDWFNGIVPTDWGFAFDLALRFGADVPAALANAPAAELTILDAGYRNGRLTGTIEPRLLGAGLTIPISADGGLALRATSLAGTLAEVDGRQQIEIAVGGALLLPESLRCSSSQPGELALPGSALVGAAEPDQDLPAGAFRISSAGEVSGRITGFVPGCPLGIGPLALQVTGSALEFRHSAAGQVALLELDGAAALLLETEAGAPQATIQVTVDELALALPDLTISAGSIAFNSSFALAAAIADGGLDWRPRPADAPPAEGDGIHLVLPRTVTLDRTGLRIDGQALASLAFADSSFQSLAAEFSGGFTLGLEPFAVRAGRADLRLNETLIAYVDPQGFWPGDIFGIIPVPARLGLPSVDVAYLQLRDETGRFLVESSAGPDGLRLQTRPNAPVRLYIPALADQSGAGDDAVPSTLVDFDLTINPATNQVVTGGIGARSPEGQSLLALTRFGLPLEVRGIAYSDRGGLSALTLDADLRVPQLLGTTPIRFDSLTVTSAGLSGTARVGTYRDTYDAGLPAIASALLTPESAADSLRVELTGARIAFGTENDGLELAGVLRSTIFSDDGATAPLFFTGRADAAGVALAVDPGSLPGGKLPLGVATFEPAAVGDEPALQLRAGSTGLTLRLSGILALPSLDADLALTIVGLEVGTGGVSVASVALSDPGEWQKFELFGATFTLRDSTANGQVVYPALGLAYENRVLRATLSGTIEFLENTTTFHGLELATDGSIALAEASLISRPIALVDDLLTLESLAIAGNRLEATGSLTLPEPLGSAGPQTIRFAIAPDGTIEGGATIRIIDEAEGLGGERTQFDFGIGVVHPRYVALDLDLSRGLDANAVQVVADFYLADDQQHRIKLGNTDGGVVSPGLRVALDGDIAWGNLALAGPFTFDFDLVRLGLHQVSARGSSLHDFAIGFSGELGLKLDGVGVSGGVAYQDFTITNKGEIQLAVKGLSGHFTIADLLVLELNNFDYGTTRTAIEVASGGIGGSSGNETIQVESFIRFGGKITVMGGDGGETLFGGGVEEFLLYRGAAQDAGIGLVVRQATLDIYEVVSMRADLVLATRDDGFELVLGGSAKLLKDAVTVAVVGAIAKEANDMRMGVFLAATGINLPITPVTPVAAITGLGGGFFYRPKPQWLDLVRDAAGVSGTAGHKITSPDPGKFAILLFGEAAIPPAPVVKGRVLLTVTETALQVDGVMTVFDQGNRFTGEGHLLIGLKRAYAEGNIALNIDYGPVVSGSGDLEFAIYGADNWMISGTANARIAGATFLKADADLFIGPPGFNLAMSLETGVSFALVSLKRVEGQVWLLTPKQGPPEWGAAAGLTVTATIIPSILYADGTLRGALVGQGTTPYIYAVAELKAKALVHTFEGSVWATIKNGSLDAGLGRDPAMEALLARADLVKDQMNQAREEAQNAVETARNTIVAQPVILSDAELAAAYMRARALSELRFLFSYGALYFTELHADYAPQPGERAYLDSYLAILREDGAPADSARIKAHSDTATTRLTDIESRRPAVEARLAAIQTGATTALVAAQAPVDNLPNPVAHYSFAKPVTRPELDANGDTVMVVLSGPGFQIDPTAAQQVRGALQAHEADAAAARQRTLARIQELESALAALRSATTTSDPGSFLDYARMHAGALASAERHFAAQADLILRKQDWTRARRGELLGREAAYNSMLGTRSSQLVQQNRFTALDQLAYDRTYVLSQITGNQAPLDQLAADRTGLGGAAKAQVNKQHADAAGKQIWFEIARSGLNAADTAANSELSRTNALAEERLGAIRSAHGTLSESLDGLYRSQIELTGVLHDLYDRYLFEYEGESGAHANTSGQGGTTTLAARRTELARDLQVPKLTSLKVFLTPQPYTAELTVNWTGTHPAGTYEFLFRDLPGTGAPLQGGLYSNGPSPQLTSYRFPAARGAQPPSRTMQVGVRGGAGFVAEGRASYSVAFPPAGTPPVPYVMGTLATDMTPPAAPVIDFPGLPTTTATNGIRTTWTADRSRFEVRWNAYDPESGIGEYQYALGSGASADAIRPWTSVGGRTSLTVEGVDLPADQPLYISVRARNGASLWSDVTRATVRVDRTPPYFPAPAPILGAPLLGLVAFTVEPVLLRSCQAGSSGDGAWSGRLGRIRSRGLTPSTELLIPGARDTGSEVATYYIQVDTIPAAFTDGTGWTRLPASAGGQQNTISGAPLDYERAFFLTVVAADSVGNTSERKVIGPFSIPDPTRPTDPIPCAGQGITAAQLAVHFQDLADDPETGIAGYEFRVRNAATGQVVRDWPTAGPDWTGVKAGAVLQTPSLPILQSDRYFVDVRAVNGHGMRGQPVTTGAFHNDRTPPPNPAIAVAGSNILSELTFASTPVGLTLTTPADPHSGGVATEYAIGTTTGTPDRMGWTPLAPEGGPENWARYITLPGHLRAGTYWIMIRTRNAAGLLSETASTKIEIRPVPTPTLRLP